MREDRKQDPANKQVKEDTTQASSPGYRGRDPSPEWQGPGQEQQGGHRPASTLFQESQPKLNQAERSNYGNMDSDAGASGEHTGSHAAEGGERVRSRSADPGQSSYGGFSNQDPRRQRQELRDYTMPKGYTRTDERIRDDICERLAYSGLDVSEVEVKVSEGVATLEGTVAHDSSLTAIEDHVTDCLGVQGIQNHVRVQQAGDRPNP